MILGIDSGTTKSVIGYWKNDEPFIIPDNKRIIKSFRSIDEKIAFKNLTPQAMDSLNN